MTLVALRDSGSRPPLICAHPIGGHVNEYRRLAERLGADQPVYAIESNALRAPFAEHATIAAMAADYAAQLLAARPHGPYRLAGWSMGALTAHAMACELERAGAEVELVGLIGPPPERVDPLRSDPTIGAQAAIQIFHPRPPPSPHIRRVLRGMTATDPATVAAYCQDHDLLPGGAEVAEGAAAVIVLLPRHAAMVAAHRPSVCRARLQVWTQDMVRGGRPRDWAQHTAADCTFRHVGGTHFRMLRPPGLEVIAADLA